LVVYFIVSVMHGHTNIKFVLLLLQVLFKWLSRKSTDDMTTFFNSLEQHKTE